MTDPRPPHAPRPGHASAAPGQDAAPPLSVWATAQQDARTQRRGRYLPASTAHPAKMLPAIAATAITRYSEPGDLVADPMCGIGTTLVEAIHLGRDAIGVEYEPRWAHLAAANITYARRQGAPGAAEVIRGDARQLPALLPARQSRGGWRWWSPHPPTGAPSTGRSAPRNAPGAAGCTSTTTATATTPPTSPATAWTTCSPGSPRSSPAARCCCAPAGPSWSPPGRGGSTASWSTCPAPILAAGASAGLIPAERCVALLAGLRGQRLIPRPSFFQLDNIRKARARGEPWHLIVHEDVLVFRAPGSPGFARTQGSTARTQGRTAIEPRRTRSCPGTGDGCLMRRSGRPALPAAGLRPEDGMNGREGPSVRAAAGRGAGWRGHGSGGRRPVPPAPALRAVPVSALRQPAGPARPEVTPAGMPAVAVTDRVVQIDPAAGGEVGAVFFQFGQHAHGERDGGADLLGPAFWFLAVPLRDRDQVPAHDGPGPGADRQRSRCPGPAARCTRTSPPWACRPPAGRTRAVNSAPGIAVDCGDQQPFSGPAGTLPGQVQHIHVIVAVGVIGETGHAGHGTARAGGIAGYLRCRPGRAGFRGLQGQ